MAKKKVVDEVVYEVVDEAVVEAQEASEELVETPRVEIPKISFEDFLKEHTVHPGLVASFTYEAKKEGTLDKPKTSEEWQNALEAQSNRKYK